MSDDTTVSDGSAGIADDDDLDTEREVLSELAETRRRIAEVPAVQVISNHAMGMFELAAIHLSAGQDHIRDAALAIDGMGALVEGLADRLGEHEPVLRDALAQIRLAFVQMKASQTS